jgi:acetyltransferase-like isoleucine patch superfamily enzyme
MPFLFTPSNIAGYFRKKGCVIGEGNQIFIKDFGSEPYLVRIGNHCTISGEVQFITHDGGVWIFKESIPKFGKIEIKDNCFIGYRSIILPNVTIGPNSVVGAGSVVTKNVPPNTVVAGVPARVLYSSDEYKMKCIAHKTNLGYIGNRAELKRQLNDYFWGKRALG